jgi:hypothetical protein
MAYCSLAGEGVATSVADVAPSLTSVTAILSRIITTFTRVTGLFRGSLTDAELFGELC